MSWTLHTNASRVDEQLSSSASSKRTNSIPSTQPVDQAAVEAVRRGLESLRRRLLDLTNRNRLISFRHGRTSLRVVNVNLEQVYSSLLEEKPISFLPVPEPPESKFELLNEKPSAKDFAAEIGWNTDYELILDTGGSDCLSVLHYQEDFEVVVRKIGTAARTALEESGTNILHLIFGFLEWRESDDSTQIRQSPLLAIPVSLLTPKSRDSDRSIRLQYTGEDLTANLSLIEKMKRDFGLVIPDIEEGESPEEYFQRFSSIIALKRHWRICRQVSLALLSFGKLLMYLDLDPERWPSNSPLERHPRLLDLFSGTAPQGLSIASEYDIDDEADKGDVPPLVYDADSSQHSALIDAVRGKNLVIEGPPGTGKSQTITNLIAASIAGGKRVLFVAEKMAALGVVKRRLDACGLGEFCLELHSHKTSKVSLLKSLDSRIQANSRFSAPTTLEHKQSLLNLKRDQLRKYAALLHRPYAAISRTPFELIWQRDALLCKIPPVLRETNTLAFPDANSWDYKAVSERKDAVTTYSAHLQRIQGSGGSVEKKENPWGWLPTCELGLAEQDRILTSLPLLVDYCSQRIGLLQEIIREVSETLGNIDIWVDKTEAWIVGGIPVAPHDHHDLIEPLSTPTNRRNVEDFLSSLSTYRKLIDIFPNDAQLLDRGLSAEFTRLDAELARMGLMSYSLATLRELDTALLRVERQIVRAKNAARLLSSALEANAGFTLRSVTDLVTARHLMSEAPLHLAHLRGPQFAKDGLVHLLEQGKQVCAALAAERDSLSEQFLVESDTPAQKLLDAASVLDQTPWYRRFGRTFRAASLVYRSHSKAAQKRNPRQKASGLRLLAHHRAKLTAFICKEQYREHLGETFQGLETNWEDLIVVARWHEELFARLPEHQPFASVVRNALLTLPGARLRNMLSLSQTIVPQPEELESSLQALTELHALVPEIAFDCIDTEIDDFLVKVRSIVSVSRCLLASLEPLQLKDSCKQVEIANLLGNVEEARRLRDALTSNAEMSDVLGKHYRGTETSAAPITEVLVLIDAVETSHLNDSIKEWLLTDDYESRLSFLMKWLKDLRANETSIQEEERNVVTALGTEKLFGERNSVEALGRAVSRLGRCVQAQALLPLWIDAQRSAQQLRAFGLEYVVSLSLSGAVSPESLSDSFDYLFCDTIVRRLFNEHGELWGMSGITQDEVRQQFSSLDRSVMELNQLDLAYRSSRCNVPGGIKGSVVKEMTDLALIQHEISKQRAHIPIRQLMERAGRAIQALKPCFMMSPMSVAQFLAPGRVTFDLIVMDEASQLRPEEALGAIGRGTQIVVVGDPKQLPPTSFFQRTLDDEAEDEEKSTVAEGESILDTALTCYQPVRRLRWHYRSQHHSLIAFSNSEFYDDHLVVFPSAYHEHDDLGVKYIEIQGICENRRNAIEAERVVNAVIEHIASCPGESLGVVTMNFEQRELIEELLYARLKGDSLSNSWIESREETPEPFFIRNLENVQGDERDVIFISVTYGPDSQGNYYQRYAGVNTQSGHRRLNVLITRAKKRCIVFSSLDPDMIQTTPASPWGVRALKGYMQYARSGISAQPVISPGAESSNEHEAAVGSVLKANGYDVVPQVGVSGYFIDLAVRHPKKPGTFLLGVEFDGKSYHSGRSTRDRDRLRQMALENQGWKIHRIWSTDWFKNRNSEIERLLNRVRTLETQ